MLQARNEVEIVGKAVEAERQWRFFLALSQEKLIPF